MPACPPLLAISNPSRAEHADFFWRLERPYARLRERGVTADICWLGDDEMPTVSPAGRVVVIQRTSFITTNAWTGMIDTTPEQVRTWTDRLRDAGALAVVAEMDDDTLSDAYMDWLDASGGLDLVRRERLLTEREAWRYAVAACDGVTVSTDTLAERVRAWTDAAIIVLPNAIDAEWFTERLAPRPEWAEHLTIGWAGGRRPEADLAPMAEAWGRIAARYPHVRFVVAGWIPDCVYEQIEDIDRIIRVPWQALEDYPAAMQVDIGCCPLADTPFNRAKSPIKAWEYALAGAAVIASPTVYRPYVQPCIDGEIAETADDWYRALHILIESADWRRKLNGTLRRRTERQDSLAGNLGAWVEAYARIAMMGRVPA